MSFYVTTPIYYVNANPHLGHAYTTIAADVASRHMRQRGEDVFFLTGTDEHGSKVARSAAAAGLSPKEFCDQLLGRVPAARRAIFAPPTTSSSAPPTRSTRRFVQAFVERMRASGDVYEDTYSGLYCTACEAFYTDDDLVDGMCPIHGTPPEWVEEKNWFFRLSAYEDRLRDALRRAAASSCCRAPATTRRGPFIEGGLKDISLSRASIEWGVPVPWEPDQVDLRLDRRAASTTRRPSPTRGPART